MKFFINFFLSLCLFLFGGYSAAYASTYHNNTRHSYQQKTTGSEQLIASSLQRDLFLTVRSLPAPTDRDKIDVGDSEDEDEELITFKKATEVNNYFSAFFCAQPQANFCTHIKKCLLSGKHFSFVSHHRYIVFRVIRI